MRIVNVVGARPNFMKMGPILEACRDRPELETVLVHTGQHYDHAMSDLFFEQLQLPRPDVNLSIAGGSHASQTARVMMAFEGVCVEHKPDLVLVVGDVNSTLACALVASKLGIRVAHVEAGLRAFDRTMPEEINRVLTDSLSDLLFVSEESGLVNLAREGIDHAGVHFVGNVMIDSLHRHRAKADCSRVVGDLDLKADHYAVLTMHRPANVDDPRVLSGLLDVLIRIGGEVPIVFPAHPRTLSRLDEFGLRPRLDAASQVLRVVTPLGYLDFLKLVSEASLILTDSGGIQEETTVLGVPCITLRDSTERPATCLIGTNRLAGSDPDRVWEAFDSIRSTDPATYGIPARWDGKTGRRIADILTREAGAVKKRAARFGWADEAALARLCRVEDEAGGGAGGD